MSDPADASRTEATAPDAAATGADAPEKTSASPAAGKAAAAQKPPSRPPAEIRAELFKERAELGASFDALRAELDEAAESARRRAAGVGRKAKIIAPAAGVALAVALLLRSRARHER